jgi:hypothetical protein
LTTGADHVAERLVIGSSLYPNDTFIWGSYIRSGSFYNFKTGATVNSTSTNYAIGELACGSLFSRYGNDFQTVEETYSGITASTDSGLTFSQENAIPLMRKVIDDGRVTQTYFAQKVIQKPSVNQMVVTWIKE